MNDAWYTVVADELARCIADARRCAEACEELLEQASATGDEEVRRQVLGAVVAPAAIARVLVDLIDEPQPLLVAAAALCRESADAAVARLDDLERRLDTSDARRTLAQAAASCERLLDAV